jgi:tricarballylate dehydrogenase
MTSRTVVVVGGGNAGLCAAMAAREQGSRVVILERGQAHLRGGNSRHTRNVRTAHYAADAFVSGAYPPAELRADIGAVTGDDGDPELTDLLVAESTSLAPWMTARGARWQAALRGTLHLTRTNRFFLGGGKTLINAYYRTVEAAGVDVRYDAHVIGLEWEGDRCRNVVVRSGGVDERVACDALVVAAGGFEANIDWLAEYWGDAARNFIVRGTPLNDGTMLRLLLAAGAVPIGDPTRFHAVAVDARSPRFDGGIVTRLDAIPIGIVVDRHGRRFHDEGEDLWPKRYATWGRLIAEQDGQLAFAIVDARNRDAIMPPLYRPFEAETVEDLAEAMGVDSERLGETVRAYNASIPTGQASELDRLDGRTTVGLSPPKSNWAVPIDRPPYWAFPLRPGITFTYHGVGVDRRAKVKTAGGAFENVFAAGEIMAGNILTRGYLAGIGMTIGSVFGRIAGREAALNA